MIRVNTSGIEPEAASMFEGERLFLKVLTGFPSIYNFS